MFEIVSAEKGDADDIRGIIRSSLCGAVSRYYSKKVIEAMYDYYSTERINSFDGVFVARKEGDIIGCIAYRENELKMLYLDPEFKDRKYAAEMLLIRAKKDLIDRGYEFGWANALDSSISFLEKHCVKKKEVLEDVIGRESFRVTRVEFPLT